MCNLGEGLIEKYTALGEARGDEKERINTELERKRSDYEESKIARELEENARLKMQNEKEFQAALEEAARIAKDPSVKGYTDMDELFADLEK